LTGGGLRIPGSGVRFDETLTLYRYTGPAAARAGKLLVEQQQGEV